MKRFPVIFGAVLGLALSTGQVRAEWGTLSYSGYQPWWEIFAHRDKSTTPEEERLQKFWHDYYGALKNYYSGVDHIDWVDYYKKHGYQTNGTGCANGCCPRVNYAPVTVPPTMQWAVPNVPAGPAAGR